MIGDMKPEERVPFIAGIIEGIAYHRYMAGGKDATAMNCVYDWFYGDAKSVDTVFVALGEFPNHPPAAVVAALAKKKCGG